MAADNFALFTRHLIHDLALPALQEGYAALVLQLKQAAGLKELALREGLPAVLASEHPELLSLQKHNKELVTGAEKIAEARMRQAVKARYPEHAIVGEEHGVEAGSSRFRWVFDPVDGTSALVRTALADAFGITLSEPVPAFGITVALVLEDQPVLGAVTELVAENGMLTAPCSWLAEKGKGATCNDAAIFPLPVPPLSDALLSCTVPEVMFPSAEAWSGYQALSDAVKGCVQDQNCIGFMRLLSKRRPVHIVYEADLAYHDAAALVPILTEAGLCISDGAGRALDFSEQAIPRAFSLLAAAPSLHQEALARIKRGVPAAENRFHHQAHHQGYAQKFPSQS